MTTQDLYIASGMTNRLGEDRYFLVMDFDGLSADDLEDEIADLQRNFSLADATIYKTHSGYHTYFFYDNRLSGDRIREILASSARVDKNFVLNFDLMMEKGDGVTIRLSGKYEKPDISFYKVIPGTRKPSLLEKNLGVSLSDSVKSIINHPLVDHKDYKLRVDPAGGPGEEKKTPIIPEGKNNDKTMENAVAIEKSLEGIPEAPEPKLPITLAASREDIQSEEENSAEDEGIEPGKAEKLEVVFPGNAKITEQRKLWYGGIYSSPVARLISASTENSELALNKLATCFNVKAPDFTEYRPFFFSNAKSKDAMLKPFNYVRDKTRFEELPFNFFHSHAKYDVESMDKVPLKDYAKQKAFKNWMRENSRELATGFDIIFDIDSKDLQGNDSYLGAKKLRDLLKKMDIPFSLNFSGSKGFHIRIPNEILFRVVPEFLLYIKREPDNLRSFFGRLVEFTKENGIQVDEKAYSGDMRCQIRVLWSVHPATGSVVKPLTDEEFDSLEGKTLAQIQEVFLVENLIKGNPAIGARKLNLQRNEFIVRIPVSDSEYISWQEAEKQERGDWKDIRNVTNAIVKELRALSKDDPKTLSAILEEGSYEFEPATHCLVDAPEWIDLSTGRNYDYRRKGSIEALRSFVLGLIK